MDKIRIASLNARGLKNKLKRSNIFNILKQLKLNIICIQEAHINKRDVRIWEKQWGGKIIYNEENDLDQREIILISKNFIGSVKVEICQERLLIVSLKNGDDDLTIVNVYAPNEPREKIRFFNVLQGILGKYADKKMIMTGDFNCVLNAQIDVIAGRPHGKSEVEQFNNTVSMLGLHDIWRLLHPEEKEFSWNRFNPFIARRLDYCFIAHELISSCVSCEYVYVPNTDHKAIIIELDQSEFIRGPGTWRFNNSYLKDKDFIQHMNEILNTFAVEAENEIGCATDTWELCKIEIRDFCTEYGRMKANQKHNKLLDLQVKLKKLENKIKTDSNNPNTQTEIQKTKHEIELIHLEKTKGYQVRSRMKWIQEGEKSTSFFCNLEKIRGKNNIINRLEKPDGNVTTNQLEILQEQVNHFKSLYNQSDTDNDIEKSVADFLLNEEFPRLDKHEADCCEQPLTLVETTRVLSLMKNGSAPGTDGLTIEFMKFFWSRIGKMVTDTFIEAMEKGELSVSQRKGAITLIHKGIDLPREHLHNWRPITLSNSDYKIIAKTLAERLNLVIQKLIHSDQFGFLKGRNIATIIRTIDDTMNYMNKTDKSGYILALDFWKAFDSVSKPFLLKTFDIFGFGENFKKLIFTLTNNNYSCINHGGWQSESFSVSCGIRQGCPLSPLMFILAAEIMAIKIRNSAIKGISLPNRAQEHKILKIQQLADDTTLFVNDKNDIEMALSILTAYEKFSGLKLNMLKTKSLALGRPTDEILPITKCNKIKILGIWFQNGKMARDIDENWKNRIDKLNNLIKLWSKRDLGYIGKVIIIKTFLTSQFTYVMQSVGLPESVLVKINKILYKFLWQRRQSNKKAFEKIKRKTLQEDYDKGGLKMIDMIFTQKCFYLQWAGKLFYESGKENKDWTCIPKYHLEKLASLKQVFDISCKQNEVKNISKVQSEFWTEVLRTYLQYKKIVKKEDVDKNNFIYQQIFLNSLVRFKKTILDFPKWRDKGINTVNDLIKQEENRILTFEEVHSKLGLNRAVTLFQYNAVINALPKNWLDWIKSERSEAAAENNNYECEAIRFNTKPKLIREYINKQTDNQNLTHTHAQTLWRLKLNYELNKETWMLPRLVTAETRLRELQWKILNNIYPTNILLNKMKVKLSNKCDLCPDKVDYIEHFFYECIYTRQFWKRVTSLLTGKIETKVEFTVNDILFGMVKGEMSDNDFKLINYYILLGKMCISIAKKTGSNVPIHLIFEQQLQLRQFNI